MQDIPEGNADPNDDTKARDKLLEEQEKQAFVSANNRPSP
jgi:hypothetical protein